MVNSRGSGGAPVNGIVPLAAHLDLVADANLAHMRLDPRARVELPIGDLDDVIELRDRRRLAVPAIAPALHPAALRPRAPLVHAETDFDRVATTMKSDPVASAMSALASI